MVIPIHIDWHEIIPPVAAGTIVSLLNKWIFNNPSLYNIACCEQINDFEHEVLDDESDNSGRTIASVDTINPHGVHAVHATVIPHFTH